MAHFTHNTESGHYIAVKARTREELVVADVSEQVLHLSEQSSVRLVVPPGSFSSQISIYLEKGSVLEIMEESDWEGVLNWDIFLIEPYSTVKHTGRLRLAAGKRESFWKVMHQAPHTSSFLDLKAVVEGEAGVVQDVSLDVPQGMFGCVAQQVADVLLMDSRATARLVPRLLVATDDASCSHGARVRRLNPRDFFYLESRGMTPEIARELIVQGVLGS